ncbi:uncharacterized protein FFB14_05785 [Fusarium fujikuroi]|nr:uncharacterized protein FFB14_05785 [Fusarium fujikuroi]
MAGPKPRATPATVVEVADEGGVVILSDDPVNSLTVDDLPMGVLEDANKQTAAQIVEILLKEGAFHHNKSSRTKPSYQYRGCWHQTCPPIVPR